MSTNLDIKKLSKMLSSKRGSKGLRTIAEEIGGVSASTLSRIEQGNLPDIDTFLKICNWLEVSPDYFTINDEKGEHPKQKEIVAHLRADRTLPKETAEALIKLITLAYDSGNRAGAKSKKRL